MPFPNLKYLNLGGNSIQVLQKNIFDFNPELELVGFDDNKIFHVNPKTFDNLRNLRFFWFTNTLCISKEIYNSKF
jgi:Leucine-rich repeat (LRR) protein